MSKKNFPAQKEHNIENRETRSSLNFVLFLTFLKRKPFFFGDHTIFYFAHTKQAPRANVDRVASIC